MASDGECDMKEYLGREAALKAFEPQCGDWSECWSAEEIKQKLDNIPAADVVEVRHGRWTEYHTKCDGGYGQIYYQHTDCSCFLYESPYNYCPNCGAKMDGGSE